MTSQLSDITSALHGCWIDRGHDKAMQLDIDIIFLAASFGYETNITQIVDDLQRFDDMLYEEQADVQEALREDAMLALDWMNDGLSSDLYFYIDDNSLFLEYDTEDNQ